MTNVVCCHLLGCRFYSQCGSLIKWTKFWSRFPCKRSSFVVFVRALVILTNAFKNVDNYLEKFVDQDANDAIFEFLLFYCFSQLFPVFQQKLFGTITLLFASSCWCYEHVWISTSNFFLFCFWDIFDSDFDLFHFVTDQKWWAFWTIP